MFYLFVALFFSFLCSILEAVLLSVTPGYASALKKKSPKSGLRLARLKRDVDRPLAAILSLNTIAHTVGAAGVGAQAASLFGDAWVGVVSGVLTLLILVFSEIIPKTLGALYWRQFAPLGSYLIEWLIWGLYPLVLLSQRITQMIAGRGYSPAINREEFQALADLGLEEGIVMETESRILKNLLRFGSLKAEDVMTPRSVLFTLQEDITVDKIMTDGIDLPFSRIPLSPREGEGIRHYVLKNDVLLAAARGYKEQELRQFARSILIAPETASLVRLFDRLLDRREHIALVVGEYGEISGIVTMEDILETVVGVEIVDETDETVDMQRLARQQWEKRAKAMGLVLPDKEDPSS
jgi:CBS domain containing-hemolysin-like protein